MLLKLPAATTSTVITALCRCNQGILGQKISLMNAIINKYGMSSALDVYQTPSSIVNASIGQHYRHSLDHIERVVDVAYSVSTNPTATEINIEYDTRKRGSDDERDWNIASDRIQGIHDMLETTIQLQQKQSAAAKIVISDIVYANFMLTGSEGQQYPLPSTIARELGFAAHHAIHHMAMVRTIIVTWNSTNDNSFQPLLSNTEIPTNFGKAPSTINYEKTTTQ